ncbi:SDR family oxidoreductase [Acrocarpospora macrocephala]|uniref:Short-chain dehydrogenase n=1 Tax=Acrocarpospora macrocephala TaxID=150177 RepID=A0A5M3WFL5_9ACTN|nr:SDR family NAD(P)-dependent oxidoreductase [Acrocarpospora macrocephala]GES07764.1 short-chain dehydrogenase [Acrocarpospora macrocephala]
MNDKTGQAARDMRGKTVVITGASAGVGAAAARGLAALGATVAVVGRSPEKTNAVARAIGAEPHLADFSRLSDVRALADTLLDRYPTIDVLANNAGGQIARRTITEDGHEMTFQVNYLAPFLLTHLLLDRLAAAKDARVISTSSQAHSLGRVDLDDLDSTRGYGAFRVYGTTKLENILFTRELARRTQGTGITATAFHPGAVASDFFRDNAILRRIMRSPLARAIALPPEKAAEPLLHLATLEDPQPTNGAYFNLLKRREPKYRQSGDHELARHLWDRTATMLGLTTAEHRNG